MAGCTTITGTGDAACFAGAEVAAWTAEPQGKGRDMQEFQEIQLCGEFWLLAYSQIPLFSIKG
jgi:hypothetical protein